MSGPPDRDSPRCLVSLRLGGLCVLLVLTACGEKEADPVVPDDPSRPSSVLVRPDATLLEVDDTVRLVAEVRDQDDVVISDWTIDWTSADPSVVAVSETGLATGLGPGRTDIYAAAGDAAGSASITVEIQPVFTETVVAGLHGCALDDAGSAHCWGSGSLGNGDSIPQELPVPVSGGYVFDQISATDAHTCGLESDGRVLCWGGNGFGQADPGSRERTITTPAEIPIPGSVVQVVAGGEFSCALLEGGEVSCWGRNNEAQLGRGMTSDQEGVGKLAGDTRYRQLALGRAHGCGLGGSGTTYCWGRNARTQVGDGTTTMASTPTPVDTDVRFLQVAASEEYSCGTSLTGLAYCWGHQSSGRLGNGSGPYDGTPVRVVDLEGVTRVESGWYHACALDEMGGAHCWGRNLSAALGSGSSEAELYSSDRPIPVAGGHGFTELSVGVGVTCGRDSSSQIYCWGDNRYGGLGIGDSALELRPTEIPAGIAWELMEPGRQFSCGIESAGAVYCWGSGYSPSGEGPVLLGGGLTFTDLSVGDRHACGIADQGRAYCWGSNASGQLGDGTNTARTDPIAVAIDSAFVDIGAGVDFSCAVTASGQTYCWGDKNFNRMGDGGASGFGGSTNVPVLGAMGVALTSVTAGTQHACGIDRSNAAYCWGSPLGDALGTGTNNESLPAPVAGGHLFESVKAGWGHTCGIDTNGAAWCWGGVGLLGTGSTSGSDVPVPVVGGTTFTELDVGDRHTCGVALSGQVYCWGYGTFGEIGDGYLETRLSPTASDLEPTASRVSVALLGYSDDRPASCAVLTDGRAACWGWNDRGQLGQPVIPSSTVPVPVSSLP